jgi:hypothetical protein
MSKKRDVWPIYKILNAALDLYFANRKRGERESTDTVIALMLLMADIVSANDDDAERKKVIRAITSKFNERVADLRKEM